jgi:hypothetical protein
MSTQEIDDDERKIQTAIGLSGEYDVSVSIPVKGELRVGYSVNAITPEDAVVQVRKLLEIKTKSQILLDARASGPYPMQEGTPTFSDFTMPENVSKDAVLVQVNKRLRPEEYSAAALSDMKSPNIYKPSQLTKSKGLGAKGIA